MATGSPRIASTVWRGCSDPYGSWNTIWTLRLRARGRRGPSFSPPMAISPSQCSLSPQIARRIEDFPQPDSPTRPWDSPRITAKLTPSTASARPAPAPNATRRLRTSISGAALMARATRDRAAGSRGARGVRRCAASPRAGRACRDAARARGRRAAHDSTMRPAYMTSTRSQNVATRLRSWLTKMRPSPRRPARSSRMASTCVRTVTSSAEVGSSAISSSGSGTSIIAIMMRWPMPPETSWG